MSNRDFKKYQKSLDPEEIQDMEHMWNLSESFSYKEESGNDEAWKKMKSRIEARSVEPVMKVSWIRRNYWAVAAGLGLLLVGGAGVWFSKSSEQTELAAAQTISTGNNEIKTLDLTDGSRVVLNSNSSLVISSGFNQNNRSVTLVGQADFEVQKNEKLVFEVVAGQTTTRVLGTGFDIRAYLGEDVNIFVKHGKVAFSNKENELVLDKGLSANFDVNSGKIQKSEINPAFLNWQNGQWVLKRTSLKDIADMFKHRFGKTLVYDPEQGDRQFTGKFESNAKPEDIKTILEEALQIQLSIE